MDAGEKVSAPTFVHLTPSLREKLEARASETERSLSFVARKALTFYFAHDGAPARCPCVKKKGGP